MPPSFFRLFSAAKTTTNQPNGMVHAIMPQSPNHTPGSPDATGQRTAQPLSAARPHRTTTSPSRSIAYLMQSTND